MAGWNDELETGLRDDFDAVIIASKFGTHPNYMAGAVTLLQWELAGVDSDGIAFEDTALITLGNGWTTIDGGLTAVHESGNPRKNFGASSHAGLILTRCLKDFNMGELLASRGSGPQDAKAWVGLKFHFKREMKTYGEGIDAKAKLMPTAFLGEASATAPTATPVPTAAVASPAAVANGAAPANTAEIVTRAQLANLAKETDNFQAFMMKAMEVEGVLTNQALLAEVTDPSKFYAQARG